MLAYRDGNPMLRHRVAAAASLLLGAAELRGRGCSTGTTFDTFWLYQHGSTIAAGKALGVSQSTVQRRLAALEIKLGRPLAIRNANGYALTAFGIDALPHAERVQAQIDAFAEHVEHAADDRHGVICVTCPEPIVPRLMPLIERFRLRYPQFQIEFVTSDRYLDLRKGDADVAFRSGDTDADLVGRKVADSVWTV